MNEPTTGLVVIHAGGLLAALIGSRLLSVRLWQTALVAAAFMGAGWLVPWPLGFLPNHPFFWLTVSLAVSVPAALIVGRLLGIGLWPASKIMLACGAGMLLASAAIATLAR